MQLAKKRTDRWKIILQSAMDIHIIQFQEKIWQVLSAEDEAFFHWKIFQ